MNITTIKASITGTRPLLMHNGRLRNPMDPWAKALKASNGKFRGSKSDDDFADQSKVEYIGGLYCDDKLGPVIPADNLQAMLVEGARKRRLGKQFEAFVEIVEPEDSSGYKLEYDGPRDPEILCLTDEFVSLKAVKIGQVAVMRTRPKFKNWSVDFDIEILPGGPDVKQVEDALRDAGLTIGLCEWTPRYGRFELTSVTKV